MPRFVLTLEYKGTNFSGSQKQPSNVRTVQDELEKAICTLTKKNTKTIFSGRTDAGVHARGQVVHFDSEIDFTNPKLLYSLNGILPRDMSISKIEKKDVSFHAQKSATARFYRYTIISRKQRSAFDENCLYIYNEPDIDFINKALEFLKGEHDFSSFKKTGTNNPAKVCKLYYAKCTKNGSVICIDLIADRFLYGMVRTIVGTVLLLERKSSSPESLEEILNWQDRTKAGPMVSPDGLTLMKVIYDKNINMEMANENIFS